MFFSGYIPLYWHILMLVIAGAVGTLCFVFVDILAMREAKKQKLLEGKDNFAAEGEERVEKVRRDS